MVSDVPSEMHASPGFSSRIPATAQGLSPDHATALQVGEKPYSSTK